MSDDTSPARPAEVPEQETPRPAWKPPTRPGIVTAVFVVLAIAAVLLILAAWGLPPFSGGAEVTQNAYVRGRTTVIAPQVNGYVTDVAVRDYEVVKAGQVLVRVDAVKPTGCDDGEDSRGALGVGVAAVEHPVLPAYDDLAKRAF